jgi:hypothetical protein
VTSGNGLVPGVGARLTVSGLAAPQRPLNAATVTASTRGSDRATLSDSFLFELPPSVLRPGTNLRLTVDLILPAGYTQHGDRELLTMSRTVTFHQDNPGYHITLYVFNYDLVNVPPAMQKQLNLTSSTWPARSLSALEPARALAENMLPVISITTKRIGTRPYPIDCGAVRHVDPATHTATWSCDGGLDAARALGTRLIDQLVPGGGGWIAGVQPETTCRCGLHVTTAAGNNRISLQQNDPTDVTLAHEMGHGLGLGHTPEVKEAPDMNYPRANGWLGPYVGLSYAAGPVTTAPGHTVDGHLGFDVMSYNTDSLWTSPYSYCKALATSSRGTTRCPDGLDATGGRPYLD